MAGQTQNDKRVKFNTLNTPSKNMPFGPKQPFLVLNTQFNTNKGLVQQLSQHMECYVNTSKC